MGMVIICTYFLVGAFLFQIIIIDLGISPRFDDASLLIIVALGCLCIWPLLAALDYDTRHILVRYLR